VFPQPAVCGVVTAKQALRELILHCARGKCSVLVLSS